MVETKLRKPKLSLSEKMELIIQEAGLPEAYQEYRFAAPERQFRFDFAYPDLKLAIEVEGGVFVQGRHSQGAGMSNDCVKYNMAAMRGWTVLRFTAPMIRATGKPLNGKPAIYENPRMTLARAYLALKSA
jgi:very-short-patch-repair endonuclease